jgi:hypothetical protein
LNLTDDQRRQFVALIQGLQREIGPLIREAESAGKPDDLRPKVMKARRGYECKIEALLTDGQKERWAELLGKPFGLDD